MTQELSDKDIEKLFNNVSNSLRSNDTTKLDELMTSEPTTEEEKVEDESLPDEPTQDEPVDTEEEDNKDGPQDTADDPVDDNEDPTKSVELDEVTKLREQLAKLEKDNHSLRSQAGRVPHVQRRLQELDKKLADLEKSAAPSSQPNDKVLAALKGIKETDPELAESVATAIANAMAEVAASSHNVAKETLTTLRAVEAESAHASEMDRLLTMYPNAKEIFASPHWKEWKTTQTDVWKAAASSDNADDVAEAFERYSRDMVKKFPELANVSKTEEVKAEPVKNERAEQIEEERARKKATTAKVGAPNAPAKVSVPDDPDALFKKFSEQIRKERTG
jgi:hypothetical protein